jgi:hypothetical protein
MLLFNVFKALIYVDQPPVSLRWHSPIREIVYLETKCQLCFMFSRCGNVPQARQAPPPAATPCGGNEIIPTTGFLGFPPGSN